MSERGKSRTQGEGDRDGLRDKGQEIETRDSRREGGRGTETESEKETKKQTEIQMDERICVR